MAAFNPLKPKYVYLGFVLIAWSLVGCNKEFLRRNALQSQSHEFEPRSLAAVSHFEPDVTRQLWSSESFTSSQREVAENLRAAEREAKAGRLDQAAWYYERVLRDDNKHAVAHHHLSMIAEELGWRTTAKKHDKAANVSILADSDLLSDRARPQGYSEAFQQEESQRSRSLASSDLPRFALAGNDAPSLGTGHSFHRPHEPIAISQSDTPAIMPAQFSESKKRGMAAPINAMLDVPANLRQAAVTDGALEEPHHVASRKPVPATTFHQNLQPYRRSTASKDEFEETASPAAFSPVAGALRAANSESSERVNRAPPSVDLPLWLPE